MAEVRALLITDVVGSTRLAERLGDDANAALWTAHDRAARDLLQRWGGREIDRADGFLLLFQRADDALGFARAYHAALKELAVPLLARAGLHVGPVTLRENTAADVALGAKPVEVEGIVKPVAARVMALACGGQTLLTSPAREALREAPCPIHSLGHWRVKGIAEPIELFEPTEKRDVRDGPAIAAPAETAKAYRVIRQQGQWVPARRIRHNLPAERDEFVGRRDMLLELERRFDEDARLVTVFGIGGSGKTRLATHFAWNRLGEFSGGVWFCDLSQARSLYGIVHAAATALEVPLGSDDPVSQLGRAIAARGFCLVILDNFEQVSRHGSETLGRWLDQATEARFMVTSREVLGLAGEEALALPPLQPDDAATLFVRRAASARADFFVLSAQDEAALRPLVRLLDGLPLAIELAAARVRVLSPAKLLARMSERFHLLAGLGGRHDRQATLRATFDWSWELLSQPERSALAQLSVFEGGFTLEAAEAVIDLSAFDSAPWKPDVVQALVDKSFVRQRGVDRFDMLVSMQDYAAEHLRTNRRFTGSGPAAEAVAQARHAHHFAALGEDRAMADGGVEVDNLVAACRRAVAARLAEAATGALEGAWAVLKQRGPFVAGVELATLVRAMPSLPADLVARIETVAGTALHFMGRMTEAQSRFAAALELCDAQADRRTEATVAIELGELLSSEGHIEQAESHLAHALALAQQLGARSLECAALNGLGTLSNETGNTDAARVRYEEALACARDGSDRRWEGKIEGNLGQVAAMQGRYDDARRHFEAALEIARELGDRRVEANARCNLGNLHQVRGNLAEAERQLEAALVAAREMGHARLEGVTLCNLGIVSEGLGALDAAQARYAAAVAVAHRIGERRHEGQFLNFLGRLHLRRERIDDARRCLTAGEALLREVGDRFYQGVVLCSLAEVELHANAREAALAAFDRAVSLARQVDCGPDSELGIAIAAARRLLET